MRKLASVSIHIIFWLVIFIPTVHQYISSGWEISRDMLVYLILSALYYPVVFYYFFFLVVPYTFENKIKTFYVVLLYVFSAILLFVLKTVLVYSLDQFSSMSFEEHGIYSFNRIFSEAVSTAFIIVIAILVRIAIYWYRDQRKKTELELHENQLELELLKAQINPHFFFNTLNNIYSLVYKKSDDAPAAVMKLSEIMRYMIYESKAELVPLTKEVEQLTNYIELEGLRTSNPGFIEFVTEGKFSKHEIPPMLLLMFAENAFKHGKRKVKDPGIRINIKSTDEFIFYQVANYLLKEPHNYHMGEGIGMQNTRRRLELLYPACHTLSITSDEEKYAVNLILDCKLRKQKAAR